MVKLRWLWSSLATKSDVAELQQGLATNTRKLNALLSLEAWLMSKFDILSAALDDIKQGLADHGTKLTEIGGDIDDLIVLAQNGGDLQPLIDKATEIKAAVTAEGDALNALAAKHDTPAPEPVTGDQPPTTEEPTQ